MGGSGLRIGATHWAQLPTGSKQSRYHSHDTFLHPLDAVGHHGSNLVPKSKEGLESEDGENRAPCLHISTSDFLFRDHDD